VGKILSDQDCYTEGKRRFAVALSTWRTARYTVGMALVTSNLGLAARSGRTHDGAELLEQARAPFTEIHTGPSVAETDLRLLECALLASEPQRVVTVGSELAAHFAGRPDYERMYATTLRLVGTALLQLGEYTEADRLLNDMPSAGRQAEDR
jgi:hypothetical protein